MTRTKAKSEKKGLSKLPIRQDVKDREALFLEHYLKNFRIGEAAIAAGYSQASADRLGSRLIQKPHVKAAIENALKQRAERAEVNADWVLVRLIKLVERCMQVEEVLDKMGRPTGVYKFDSKGANRALELIGKHIGMFRDGRLGEGQGVGGTQAQQQNHLHVHVGPDGRPMVPSLVAGQLASFGQPAGLLPPIREVVINRPLGKADIKISTIPSEQVEPSTGPASVPQ